MLNVYFNNLRNIELSNVQLMNGSFWKLTKNSVDERKEPLMKKKNGKLIRMKEKFKKERTISLILNLSAMGMTIYITQFSKYFLVPENFLFPERCSGNFPEHIPEFCSGIIQKTERNSGSSGTFSIMEMEKISGKFPDGNRNRNSSGNPNLNAWNFMKLFKN